VETLEVVAVADEVASIVEVEVADLVATGVVVVVEVDQAVDKVTGHVQTQVVTITTLRGVRHAIDVKSPSRMTEMVR
jgi:hypothetical protein